MHPFRTRYFKEAAVNPLSGIDSLLDKLKKDITDDRIQTLSARIKAAKEEHTDSPGLQVLLKMMQSLTAYLGAKKNNAHPQSMPVMLSIFNTIHQLQENDNANDEEIRALVNDQIRLYRQLQDKIVSKPPFTSADIRNFKMVILAIDWEISDDTIQSFEAEIQTQLERFSDYKIHHTYLKMIHATGRYIAAHKAQAHTDSVSFIRSVFQHFEELIDTPNMPVKDKHQMLENDIRQFQAMKARLKEQPASFAGDTDNDDPGVSPALSHIRPNRTDSNEPISPLTSLDMDATPPSGTDDMQPALSGKADRDAAPNDVMGDLFSMKDSPADELLDAIHLMDVQGGGPEKALDMLDKNEDDESGNYKKFTPERKNDAPIREIDSRLDEFFNLDPPSPADPPPLEAQGVTQEDDETEPLEPSAPPISTDDSDEGEGIVPFAHEDEVEEDDETLTFETDEPLTDDPADKPAESDTDLPVPSDTADDKAKEILIRLQSTIMAVDHIPDPSTRKSIQADIEALKTILQTDPVKTRLIVLASSIFDLFDNAVNPSHENAPENLYSEKKGIWQKLKGLFSS